MNKYYQKLLIAIIPFIIFGACENTNSVSEVHYYIPGQIGVGFVDTVSYEFFVSFCNSAKLGIINFDLGHAFWAVADSNDLEYYQGMFSNDSSLVFCNKLYNTLSDTLHVTIAFNGMNTLEHDSEKVEAVGLKIYWVLKQPKHALLSTTRGQEKYWIKVLSSLDFIKYAELNYVTYAF